MNNEQNKPVAAYGKPAAAPTARDAGTIDGPELQWLLGEMFSAQEADVKEGVSFNYDRARAKLVAHIYKHVAAAYAKGRGDAVRDYIDKGAAAEAELAKLRSTAGVGEAVSTWKERFAQQFPRFEVEHCPSDMMACLMAEEIADLRAATAPVSAAPAAWRDALRRSGANTDYHGLIAFTCPQLENFVSMIAAPSAGAPVSRENEDPNWMGKIPHAFNLSAPVSAAEPCLDPDACNAQGCRNPLGRCEDAAPVSAAEDLALCQTQGQTADGQAKTNAHGLAAVGVEEVLAHVGTSADASVSRPADGQELPALLSEALGVVESVPSTYGVELACRIRAALAMHQPQGVTLTKKFAADVLGALFWRDKINSDGYERIKQEFAAIMRGESIADIAAKQAGKAGE